MDIGNALFDHPSMRFMTAPATRPTPLRPRIIALFAGIAGLSTSGCTGVAVHEQRLVSKPNMTFEDSAVFGNRPFLTVQIEPGAAFSGGSQPGGCTSCK
jgi:hypothetical protein